jgi:arabinose-5-phosphate isomerase
MSQYIPSAKSVFDIEIMGLQAVRDNLGSGFEKAMGLIMSCRGKIVVTGVGKSGHIARKIASTFSSTGTPAVFLHPTEAGHGDIGIISDHDVILGLSYGGETLELQHVMQYATRRGIPVIAMTSKADSTLALASSAVVTVKVPKEACPLNLAPTSSSTAMLVLGDSMAIAAMKARGFTEKDFADYHPSGSLGFKLTLIKEIMHQGEQVPLVKMNDPLKTVFSVMTHREVRGAAGVIDDEGALVGIITDGVIRRHLESDANPLSGVAKDLMTLNPRTIDSEELAERALFLMQEFVINLLFVLDRKSISPKKPVGIIHIQDLLKYRFR